MLSTQGYFAHGRSALRFWNELLNYMANPRPLLEMNIVLSNTLAQFQRAALYEVI